METAAEPRAVPVISHSCGWHQFAYLHDLLSAIKGGDGTLSFSRHPFDDGILLFQPIEIPREPIPAIVAGNVYVLPLSVLFTPSDGVPKDLLLDLRGLYHRDSSGQFLFHAIMIGLSPAFGTLFAASFEADDPPISPPLVEREILRVGLELRKVVDVLP